VKILVIGGGGREHALVWKLKQSLRVEKIWCAPGNGGIAAEAECVRADTGDVGGLVAVAANISPDLTVVGPELPLVKGIADEFMHRGWPLVGPFKQAAQLEGSKIFAKEFLQRHRIPTAKPYGWYETQTEANAALRGVDWPVVIKADGLCAGKGVLVAPDADAASSFITRLLEKNELGPGGKRLMFEEVLKGEELSFIIVTDGERYAPLAPTRDYKRVFNGNRGPNTGGMGAYSCDELLPMSLSDTLVSTIVEPTMKGLARDGIRYQGFLFFGLMLTPSGPKVLEFNCRLGDPETQAIAARMDFDLAEVLTDAAAGRLDPSKLRWKPGASVCVVLASGGYPGKSEMGKPISGLTVKDIDDGVKVLHAATQQQGNSILTSGGRVLGVTATGPTLEAASSRAYEAASRIRFDGMHFRKDIGAQTGRSHAAVE
jgi:phosphoribosylamine---glycine ligase